MAAGSNSATNVRLWKKGSQGMSKIGIIGAGAFGTGLAAALAQGGNEVILWGRDKNQTEKIDADKINQRYLPDVNLPENLRATSDFSELKQLDAALLVTPAQSLRETLNSLEVASLNCPLVFCSKGIERGTGKLQSDIARELLENTTHAALSGPGFAVELAKGMPTALTLGAENLELGESLQTLLSTQTLRIYLSDDIRGVQLGGALKNVFAIACGIVVGAGLGESARAALITRGFAELSRLTQKIGGKPETLIGLSGFGDLTLSCTSAQSRNFSYGLQLAKSGELKPGQTVEGIATALATIKLAKDHNVEMPIAGQVAAVLGGEVTVKEALQNLMARPLKRESTNS
jgi:glycerol-3-phosphate dehydrogenase (NAD(P)+)